MLSKLFPKQSVQRKAAKRVLGTAIPVHLETKFRGVEQHSLDRLKMVLISEYLSTEEVETAAGQNNLRGLLTLIRQ